MKSWRFTVVECLLIASVLLGSVGCSFKDGTVDTGETADTTNSVTDFEISDTGSDISRQSELFKKAEAFLNEEFHRVYDPYYDILDLTISDWNENGNEAAFLYTMTTQYYNRDPDTVDFIKAAKDDPERYEMMYNDYLAPKVVNYFFKVVLNGDEIELYSNESPTGVEWKPRMIDDYIPKH